MFSICCCARLSLSLDKIGCALAISNIKLCFLFAIALGFHYLYDILKKLELCCTINFDVTGTTRIDNYVLNNSFMMPGFIITFVSVELGMLAALFL